jgi:hypothetical protein
MRDNLHYYFKHALAFGLTTILIFYSSKIARQVRNVLLTLLVVEFLAQYVASRGLWCKIDALTVNLFVWQLCTLLFSWIRFEILSPIIIIEQGSFCLMAALVAWILHYILLRHIELKFILMSLWFFSIVDT